MKKAKVTTSPKTRAKAPEIKKTKRGSEERWVSKTIRDAELEALLASAITKPTTDGFLEALRYGATLEVDEDDDRSGLRIFARGPVKERAGLVRVLGRLPRSVYDIEYECETIEPGKDWPKKHQAMFWRAVAEAFRDRYSDALLNFTASALARAIPWYEEHRPLEAANMLGWRARVLGYASYSEDDVLPEVDRAYTILKRESAKPEIEYEIILQICEAIRRVSGSSHPRARELFELGMRGIELADRLDAPSQRAELYGSVAEALLNGPADLQLDLASLARRLAVKAEPLAVAEAAWHRALEFEDGMFFGEFRESHVASHKEAYTRGLAAIAIRRGDLSRALRLYDELPTPTTVYERFHRTKFLYELLRENKASRDTRAEALATRVRGDLLDGPRFKDWDLEQAAEYLQYVRYRLWNLGHRESTSELVEAILEKQKISTSEVSDLDVSDDLTIDLGTLFEAAEEDEASVDDAAANHADESPEDRVFRLANGTTEKWLRETRAGLLFDADFSLDDHATIHFFVNVPEYAEDDLFRDPLVAGHMALLDARLRASLPEIRVETKLTSLALDTGVPPDTSFARALSFLGATALLARFGLERDATWSEVSVDDARVKKEITAQRSRRMRVEYG